MVRRKYGTLHENLDAAAVTPCTIAAERAKKCTGKQCTSANAIKMLTSRRRASFLAAAAVTNANAAVATRGEEAAMEAANLLEGALI